ncbi:MAG: hypothetical protein ACK4F8_11655 [Aquabacterium sp.]
MRTIEQELDRRELRRLRAEHVYLCRLEKLEKLAEPLVGELCREGKTVYYINLTDRQGRLTGKTKEGGTVYELITYLIRNKYVTAH